MRAILDQLNQDHGRVARLLDLVDYQLLRNERGESFDTSLLMNILRYLTQYQDVFHHPREDLLFARIALRSSESAREIGVLESEHALLASKGIELYRNLTDLARNDSAASEVETLLGEYVRLLRDHMSQESSHVFPLASIILIDEDWKRIDEALEIKADPLFGPVVEASYRNILKRFGTRKK